MAINHKQYLEIAKVISRSSYCKRKKVGAIIVKNGNIVSIGYNGTPSGFDNCCEDHEKTKKIVLHAELNAICKAAKSTLSIENSDLYVTLSPCIECAKLIIQCGIKNVFFNEKYRDESGLLFLNEIGISTKQIDLCK